MHRFYFGEQIFHSERRQLWLIPLSLTPIFTPTFAAPLVGHLNDP